MSEPISQSSLATYARCPRQWKARYVDKQPQDPSALADVGTAVHRVIEEYTRRLWESGVRSDKEVLAEIAKTMLAELPPEQALEASRIATMFGDSYVMTLDYVVGIEKRLEAALPCGQVLFGYLDRFDVIFSERAVVHDYKTGYKILSDAEMASDFQLLTYAWLVQKNYPSVQELAAVHLYVRYGTAKHVNLNLADVEWVEGYLDGVAQRMATDTQFAPKPNSLCSWCPALRQCMAERLVPEQPELDDLLRDYRWAQATISQVEPRLREVAQSGPIAYNEGEELGYWERKTTTYDTQRVINVCTALGYDLADYVQAKGTAARRLAKRKDDWGRMVREGMAVKTTTAFGKKRKTETEEQETECETRPE